MGSRRSRVDFGAEDVYTLLNEEDPQGDRGIRVVVKRRGIPVQKNNVGEVGVLCVSNGQGTSEADLFRIN